jgi:hypothetical protein
MRYKTKMNLCLNAAICATLWKGSKKATQRENPGTFRFILSLHAILAQ